MDDIVQGAKGILADPAASQENEMTPIRKVGIIGTGQMGSGIAHVVALSGYDVLLSDLSKERVDKGLEAIGKNLSRQIASGKITEEESKQALPASPMPRLSGPRRRRSRDRGGDRGRDGEAQDLRGALSVPQA